MPSQKGLLPVCLQRHSHAVPSVSATKTWGSNDVPLWAPSQKGCFCDWPQVQNQYFLPSFNSTSIGEVAAIVGFVIMAFTDNYKVRESYVLTIRQKPALGKHRRGRGAFLFRAGSVAGLTPAVGGRDIWMDYLISIRFSAFADSATLLITIIRTPFFICAAISSAFASDGNCRLRLKRP